MPAEAFRMLPVPATKTAAMRYVLECVAMGYFFFIAGRIPAAKVPAFVGKMAERYNVLASRNARAWSREKGRANSRLVLAPAEEGNPGGVWLYWLLATAGTGLVHEQEPVADARNPETRIAWPKAYDKNGVGDWHPMYILSARPVRSAKRGDIHRLTWIMSARFCEQMRRWIHTGAGRARSSAGKDTRYLQQAVDALRHLPGFKGVREQKRQLLREADLPHAVWDALALKNIGPYIDKHLAVFRAGDTVASRLQA